MILVRATALAALLLATACAAPEKREDAPSQDTIACALDGQRIVIRFLPDEVRLLTPDGERVVLQKVPAAAGVRYTNGLVELRSGGGTGAAAQGLLFVRDGTGYALTGCAPVMVPQPAR
ncbi:MAG: hypothetical protein IT520_01575 [Burkholderiales bacterium]|nr:hypothetical protein [Burkholderiales bacterium]